jgi:hypothetical protein
LQEDLSVDKNLMEFAKIPILESLKIFLCIFFKKYGCFGNFDRI